MNTMKEHQKYKPRRGTEKTLADRHPNRANKKYKTDTYTAADRNRKKSYRNGNAGKQRREKKEKKRRYRQT